MSKDERKEASVRGPYCKVAKPTSKSSSSSSSNNSKDNNGQTNLLAPNSSSRIVVGVGQNSKPPKVATFLAKGKPRYDGSNSEGNRFIMNDDL